MFHPENPTKVFPDLVKLISVYFPNYSNQSLLQGSLHFPPLFFSTSDTWKQREEMLGQFYFPKGDSWGEKKKKKYLHHFCLFTCSAAAMLTTPFLQRFSQQTRKRLLWSLTYLLADIFWKGHHTLCLKSKCSFYLSDKVKAESCCEKEENSPFPAFFDVLRSPRAVMQDEMAAV